MAARNKQCVLMNFVSLQDVQIDKHLVAGLRVTVKIDNSTVGKNSCAPLLIRLETCVGNLYNYKGYLTS